MGFTIVEGEPGPPGRFTLSSYIPNSRFTSKRYILLTRVWSSLGAFANLPRSIADVAFFRAEEGSSTEKYF